MIEAVLTSRELHGTMARFEMYINHVWRINQEFSRGNLVAFWPLQKYITRSNFQNDQKVNISVPVWVRINDFRCKCPDIELGKSYLIVTDFESFTYKNQLELMLTTRSAVLPWRSSWKRRLSRFKKRELQGYCKKYEEPTKLLNVYRSKNHFPLKKQSYTSKKNWLNMYSINYDKQSLHPLARRPYVHYRNSYYNLKNY